MHPCCILGDVSTEVLEAMGELVTSLLREINVGPDDVTEVSLLRGALCASVIRLRVSHRVSPRATRGSTFKA